MRKLLLGRARTMGLVSCATWVLGACGETVIGVEAAPAGEGLEPVTHDEQLTGSRLAPGGGSPPPEERHRREAAGPRRQDPEDKHRRPPGRPAQPEHDHGEPQEPEPPTGCGGELELLEIAADGEEWRLGAAVPALDGDGRLAFPAADAAGVAHLLLSDGTALVAVSLEQAEVELPLRVALDDAGNLAFVAATPSSSPLLGVFSTDADGASVTAHYAAEEGGGLGDEGSLVTSRPFALAANGTLAFSTIVDGRGALYRGDVSGELELVVAGSGELFNQLQLDVNAAGTVAMQMEHGQCGLQRGILLFDEPGAELPELDKAIAGLSVGISPDVALNDAGAIAFALPGSAKVVQVLRCPEGEPAERFELATGVYTASPTPLSARPELTLIADNGGSFASFGEVDMDSAGRVVFEAELAAGGRGIFQGPDPVRDKIVAVGDELSGEIVTEVLLGQLNDSCQLSFATVSASGRRVWRARLRPAGAP